MKIESRIELASKNLTNNAMVVTYVLRYPRIILAEVNTHRMLSRNTSSSRAVPAKKMRRKVASDPFVPWHIGKNQAGMSAGEELTGWRKAAVQGLYKAPLYVSLFSNLAMEKLGAHKQIGNRLLEPWMYVEQVVTATTFENFFEQRDHPAAEPHFGELAAQMHAQWKEADLIFKSPHMELPSNLQFLQAGEWHLPFCYEEDECLPLNDRIKLSAGRAARVSYFFNQEFKQNADIERYDKLVAGQPKHFSPLEHPCMAMPVEKSYGNFRGFKQERAFAEEAMLCYA